VAIAVAVMNIVELAIVGLVSGFARTEASFGTLDLDMGEIGYIALVWYFAQMDRLASCLSFQFTKYIVVGVNYSVEIHPGQEILVLLPYHVSPAVVAAFFHTLIEALPSEGNSLTWFFNL
jgi:hypothetical protein